MTGYKKGDRLVEAMMIGIFWVAQGAMAYTPISHVLIPMIFEYIAADFGITITYTRYTLGFLLAGAGFFIGWMLILRFIIRPDVGSSSILISTHLKSLSSHGASRKSPLWSSTSQLSSCGASPTSSVLFRTSQAFQCWLELEPLPPQWSPSACLR